MGFETDITRNIVKERKDVFQKLPKEERLKAVQKIQNMLKERNQDELIAIASQRAKVLTPAMAEELKTEQEITRKVEQESGVQPRPEGETAIFTEQERETGLPISVQAQRRDLQEKEQEAALQRKGVATREELPAGDVAMGFGADSRKALSEALSNHFKTPVTVVKHGEDFLYLDPEDQIIKRANPGVAGSIGIGLPIAGDILGTIAGGIATKGRGAPKMLAGETVGSTAGTTAGEFTRLMIGKALGVHDMDLGTMFAKAGIEGTKAGGMTLATGGLISSAKGVNNFLKGRIFTRDEALRHGLSQEQADAAIEEINKILGRKGVKGTLYTRTGDPVIGAREAEVRRNIRHNTDFFERDLSDQRAIKEALDKVTQPGKMDGGRKISSVFKKQIGDRIDKGRKIAAKTAEDFKRQLDQIGKVSKEQVGEPTRQVIKAKRDAAKQVENDMWDNIRKSAGYNKTSETYGIGIDTGDAVEQLKTNLVRRSDTASTVITKRGASKIFSGKGKKTADLADYNRELSDLRTEIRAATKNKQFGDPQIRDLKAAEEAMVQDRRLALIRQGKGDLLAKIEAAEDATRKFNEKFNRSVIGDLMAKNENDVFKIKSKDFVDKTLKGSAEEADQLLAVIGDKPSLIVKWKEGIADAYKRAAFKGGKFNKEASEEFIGKHQDVLSKFFDESELNRFRKVGGLSETVEKQSKQLERIIATANKKWGRGKMKSLDPDALVKFVTNDSGSFIKPLDEGVQTAVNKIKYVKNMTKNYPGAWSSFKEEFGTSLRNDLLDNKTGFINPTKMAKLVKERESVIKEIMGDEYYNNLSVINEVVQLTARKPQVLSGSETVSGIKQIFRSAVAPPLTRRGRAFTAVVIFDNKRAHDVMAEALLNPESMKTVAKLAEHNTLTREALELAASVGIIGATNE